MFLKEKKVTLKKIFLTAKHILKNLILLISEYKNYCNDYLRFFALWLIILIEIEIVYIILDFYFSWIKSICACILSIVLAFQKLKVLVANEY